MAGVIAPNRDAWEREATALIKLDQMTDRLRAAITSELEAAIAQVKDNERASLLI